MNIIPEFKNKTITAILVNLVCLAVALLISKIIYNSVHVAEGFAQNEPFVLKTESDTYDDFYAEAYDNIFLPNHNRVIKSILEATGADEKSRFLDVGSGTGSVLKTLGNKCIGIEKSKPMIEKCKEKCSNKVVNSDVSDPLNFSKYQFSHILCLDKTIYELDDIHKFFTNCRYWLKNGGYLVVQLVNPQKFNAIVPAAAPIFIQNPQKYSDKRITKSEVDFGDHIYTAKYTESSFVETFTDKTTGKVRQNERKLQLQDENAIIKLAQMCGFSVHGKINMEPINEDEYQSLYIFI